MTSALGSGVDIFLHPGEWYFGGRETRIHTTLGSCVAVTLWHPTLKVGGMCHYMLPGLNRSEIALNGRYANDALELLAVETRRLCSQPGEYEAKLFGGASMFDVGPGGSSVAQRNVEAAEALVREYSLNVVARSLGGSGYRQLVFHISNGDVWMRQGEARNEDRYCSGSGDVA